MRDVELNGEQRAILIRVLKEEIETLQLSANKLLKAKESRIEEYEDVLEVLEVANKLLFTLEDWHIFNLMYNKMKRNIKWANY